VRAFVLTAFAATIWFLGPRAAEVLAAKFDRAAQHSPLVDLDRVGFVARPEWVDQPLLLAISKDLGPWLQDQVPILDEAACVRLHDGLVGEPWVQRAEVERAFPDRLKLRLDLRRPVVAVRAADGGKLCLLDREGIALPWVDTPLPVVWMYREGGATTLRFELGKPVGENRALAAAAIAIEWRDEVAPLVPGCPALLEIDTTNLGERWMRGRGYPEVRIKLRRDDGAPVVFAYDHPVGSPLPRVPHKTKAEVLSKVLARHPGLRGLIAGDLRMQNRWADYLQPRGPGVPDPDGPWSELEGDGGRSGKPR